ncbi:MAG TPA: hypothetical protein VMY88_03430 [Acidimicrobiales bacterium]|nr:hypothetical protein [Acidimicrobiales bacterium]
MRLRNLALGITAVGLLAVGTATPSPAAEVKKFEGDIALPLPVVSAELAADYVSGGELRLTCPEAGEGDGVVYKFFDLGAEYRHFFVSGPDLMVNEEEPSGVYGTVQDYDLDLHLFDAKCNILEVDGSITGGAGYGNGSVAGKKSARYAAVSYFLGAPNIHVTLEASNEKIVKK